MILASLFVGVGGVLGVGDGARTVTTLQHPDAAAANDEGTDIP